MQTDLACPECRITRLPPAMPGLEKTNLPAGRPNIEGGFGGLDSAGEACETAGTPVKCSPWFVQGPEILQLKQKKYMKLG